MDRCEKAYQYHKSGFNCAQCVSCVFSDLTGVDEKVTSALAGTFGGGVGGSHEEICGAASGALMVLGLLYPHDEASDMEAKRRSYALGKEFRKRFTEVFGGLSRCGDLLKARPGVSEKTPAAKRLGITGHCDIMIVTAVELLEQMLEELKAEEQ